MVISVVSLAAVLEVVETVTCVREPAPAVVLAAVLAGVPVSAPVAAAFAAFLAVVGLSFQKLLTMVPSRDIPAATGGLPIGHMRVDVHYLD